MKTINFPKMRNQMYGEEILKMYADCISLVATKVLSRNSPTRPKKVVFYVFGYAEHEYAF